MDRKKLNKNQTNLRDEILKFKDIELIRRMFLIHHSHLHSSKVNCDSNWSYEDELLSGLSEKKMRFIPEKLNHSIVWCLWHIARIEDVTMNILIRGDEQVFKTESYQNKLNIRFFDTGNGMSQKEISELSQAIDIEELKNYRMAVGKQTQLLIKKITIEKLKEKIFSNRIERLFKEKALRETAVGIAEYWSKKTAAGLLLMPSTRHNILHLNEINNLRKKRR